MRLTDANKLLVGLSGGQKARIALARALYARPEIMILDDVFSALDKATEEHIFQALFGGNGLLNGKTTILATNAGARSPIAKAAQRSETPLQCIG